MRSLSTILLFLFQVLALAAQPPDGQLPPANDPGNAWSDTRDTIGRLWQGTRDAAGNLWADTRELLEPQSHDHFGEI